MGRTKVGCSVDNESGVALFGSGSVEGGEKGICVGKRVVGCWLPLSIWHIFHVYFVFFIIFFSVDCFTVHRVLQSESIALVEKGYKFEYISNFFSRVVC